MEDKDPFINFCIANWVYKKEKQTCVAVMHVPVRLPLEQAPFLNSQSGLRTIFNQPTTAQSTSLTANRGLELSNQPISYKLTS